jgi:hypothetical protein
MIGLRLIAFGGILSDVDWLNAKGFDEAGLIVDGQNPSPAFIHNAGIHYATLNPFNGEGDGPGTSGDKYTGYMQAIRSAGWDTVAGGGVSGDIVRVAMNHLPWCNCGSDDVYSPPYNHPASGPNTYHVDYIETTADNVPMDAMEKAVAVGTCAEVGIKIGLDGEIASSDVWITAIDTARAQGIPCDNVCFYSINTDVVALLQTDAYEVFLGLVNHYGIRNGIGGWK